MSDPLFVTHKDYDNYHVAYIFKIEEQFMNDVTNFLIGKYSLFSKTLRQRIQKFYGDTDLAGTIKIINKDAELKKQIEEHLDYKLPEDAELASIPEVEEETYNIQ
jgi:hypothetical protein